MFRVMINTETY